MKDTLSKTGAILAFEEKHGRPAEQVIAEAVNTHGSVHAAAKVLGVSHNTLYVWIHRLRIHIKTVAEAPQAASA